MQPVQVKMARAALDLSVEQLAGRAGLSASDVAMIERGAAPQGTSAERLRATFEAAGIEWIDDDGVRYRGPSADEAISIDRLTTDNDSGAS